MATEKRYACEFGDGSPYGSTLYEEGSEHLPGFISVFSDGKCGGDSDLVCAACFLRYVQPATEQHRATWERGRWIEAWDDDADDYVEDAVKIRLPDGKWKMVTVDEAIETAKQITGEQVVRHA